jgi:DNA sulfur modification protein DndC
MEGFIESGAEWMRPLNDFRNWLKDIREDPSMRSSIRRDKKTYGPGPFHPKARKQILDRLLKTEQEVGRILISDEEIIYIQQQWDKDFNAAQAAYRIAARYAREIPSMPLSNDFTPDDKALLQDLIAEY